MGICILREMHGNRLQCMLYSLQCGRISYSYNFFPFRAVRHFFALLALALERVHADLLVVLLQGSHVLAGLGELALLHALSHVPVNEGPLGIHEIKLVVEPSPGFSNGSGVAEHAHRTRDLGQVSARNNSEWLVVDADLEASGTPIHKLDGPLGLDGCNGSIDILGDNISTVEHAAGHVFSVTRITLDHLIGRLKAGVGDLRDRQLLVVGFFSRDDWSIGDKWEVDAGIGHQVGLELGQINIEGAIKPQ